MLGRSHEGRTQCNRRRQRLKYRSSGPGAPRTAGSRLKPGRARKGPPHRSQREPDPADTLISDFSLQNSEIIHFCWFKPHSLWHLDTAVLGNESKEFRRIAQHHTVGDVAQDPPEHNRCDSHVSLSTVLGFSPPRCRT